MPPTETADPAQSILRGTAQEEERRRTFVTSGWWVSIPLTTVTVHWLLRGDCRIDGEYYAAEALSALRALDASGLEIIPLGELVASLYILGRFRRVYASDKRSGWPYLSASEALEFRPWSERWIAKDHAPRAAKLHFAKQGWLLISSSGTVGRIVLVSKRLEEYFLTHDLIRVIPAQKPLSGYLYTYLSTWIGQALISKDQYGSAIKHLEPHHIAAVPVPLLPEGEQLAIHKEILRAYALRDEANDLLDRADNILHVKLGLPRFDESLVPYLSASTEPQAPGPPMPHPKAFTVRALKLDARLDASYHVPIVGKVIDVLGNGKHQPIMLKHLVGGVYLPPRFKRIYVSEQFGIPFLQGSHLPEMRPYDQKYLSRRANARNIEECIVEPGWVLVTRSGTIGRIALVTSRQKDWAASEHLPRITPNSSSSHPGYIVAFLSTPYGQHQLTAKVHGGVVDELTPEDVASIWIPNAPLELQAGIGELVVSAYEKKDEATAIEEAAIARLEERLVGGNTHPLFERASDGSHE